MEDTTIEDVLKTVEDLYARKEYEKALNVLEKYKSAVNEGVWHYNMGTLKGKLEQWPMARYHFLMADEAGFPHKELRVNSALVERKLEVEKLESPLTAKDYVIKTGLLAQQGIFTLLGLLMILAGIAALWKKASLRSGFISFGVALFFFALNWYVHTLDKKIVLSPRSVYEGPSAIFRESQELPAGTMIITTEKNGWLEVIYPSRFSGWIKDEGLKELK